MKTISIRLEDDIYEEISEIIENLGQTKQTFYETYTRTVIREGEIPFIISTKKNANASHIDKVNNTNDYGKPVNRVAERSIYSIQKPQSNDLYQLFMQLDPSIFTDMISETNTEEENRFYNELYNLILQKKQKDAINNGLF